MALLANNKHLRCLSNMFAGEAAQVDKQLPNGSDTEQR
jgi:hypothetical protein